jgi:hypothetical protein
MERSVDGMINETMVVRPLSPTGRRSIYVAWAQRSSLPTYHYTPCIPWKTCPSDANTAEEDVRRHQYACTVIRDASLENSAHEVGSSDGHIE